MSEKPTMLTAREVAAILRVDLDTVYRAAKRGELPGRKVGRQWRFDREDVFRTGPSDK